jgi:hypothetical protein
VHSVLHGENVVMLDSGVSALCEQYTAVAEENILTAAAMIGAVGFEHIAAKQDIEFLLEIAGQIFKDGINIGNDHFS